MKLKNLLFELLLILGFSMPLMASAEPDYTSDSAAGYQLPMPEAYPLAPAAIASAGALTEIAAQTPAAISLKAMLDMNPYKPKQDNYLSWAHNPAAVWVSARAEAAARESGNAFFSPDTFILARSLDNNTALFTAELQAEARWYARIEPKQQPVFTETGLLSKAKRVMSNAVSFDPAQANTVVYGATTVYAYPGGTLISLTDVVARINQQKVEIAAGVITHNASAQAAARQSMQMVSNIISSQADN
ncbi:MAG TPA: hypothetical protein VFX01_01340 [Methylophilaceae bacterium]|nr:hypothetical protein [Methylophilaceae bacterium]